jgi:hypothetical protein
MDNMKSFLVSLMASFLMVAVSFGQAEIQDTTQVNPQQEQQKPAKKQQAPGYKRIYLGGYMSLTVGSYTRIGVYPLLGYKFTPKLSGGLKIGYEYVRDNRYLSTFETSNYGDIIAGGLNFRPIPEN